MTLDKARSESKTKEAYCWHDQGSLDIETICYINGNGYRKVYERGVLLPGYSCELSVEQIDRLKDFTDWMPK
jgi:hypothetical protein